ncbi:MAG TPA: hypothetical protein V6D17_20005 [Candidatus Obscuribacterales bacterium]
MILDVLMSLYDKAVNFCANALDPSAFRPADRVELNDDIPPRKTDVLQEEMRKRMERIEEEQVLALELTLEEKRTVVEELRQEFMDYALTTQRVDRDRVEEAILSVYRSVELALSSDRIIWFESPLDLVAAAILMRNIYSPYPTNGACLSAGHYGPYPAFFEIQFSTFRELEKIPHRMRLARPLAEIIDQMLSIDGLRTAWSNINRGISNSLTIGGAQIDRSHAGGWEVRSTDRALSRERLLKAQAILARHLGTEKRKVLELSHKLESDFPWWAARADDPRWMLDNYLHSPLLDAPDLLRREVYRALGFAINADQVYMDVLRAGGWWAPFRNFCLACDNPLSLSLDNQFRLHNENDMAIRFEDGSGFWSFRGTPVPKTVALGHFSLSDIDNEPNVEIRRVMIERYGFTEYIKHSLAERIHQDDCGTLFRKEFRDDEPITFLQVVNKTPEPDGTYRTYLLRVPPHIRSAREGVAWTFRMNEYQYKPTVES